MKIKVVWLQPPMYPVNHQFFNCLAENVDLIIYQIGDHPNFKIDDEEIFSNKKYTHRLINDFTYNSRKNSSLKFLKFLRNDNPDVVVSVAFWIPSFYLALVKNIFSFKLIITTDATSYTEKNINSLKNLSRKFISYKSDHFIAASSFTKSYLANFIKGYKISISRQTIDTKKWMSRAKKFNDKNHLRNFFSIPLDKVVLLGVGRFEERKNWDKLIETVLELPDSFYLILVGEGDLEKDYNDKIKRKGIEQKISILPWMKNDEILQFYCLADIFVFPSLKDHFGFVIPEALSSGLPVISSKYVGASEFITNGFNGFVIDPDSDFKDKIYQISTNSTLFRKNSFISAQRYSLQNRADEHLNIFKKVLQNNGK